MLSKYFPIVEVLFDEKGISQSEAQRLKEANKNLIQPQLKEIEFSEDKIYDTKREVISNTGIKDDVILANKILVKDFEFLYEAGLKYGESAIYNNGIKTKEDLFKKIKNLSSQEIAKVAEINEPVDWRIENKAPIKESAVEGNIDLYCDLDNIESLFAHASHALIYQVSSLYQEGMRIESQAGILGNQLTKEATMLRKIMNAPAVLKGKQDANQSIIVEYTKVLAVDKEEFKSLYEEMMDNYTNLQMRRNSIVKQIKDAARKLQSQYDNEYSVASKAYNEAYRAYVADVQQFDAECEKIRTSLLQEVADLKIKVA